MVFLDLALGACIRPKVGWSRWITLPLLVRMVDLLGIWIRFTTAYAEPESSEISSCLTLCSVLEEFET